MVKLNQGSRTIRADFDLRQLEIFCKVVELGSVSKAAEAVNLTQSSVSERMGNLEKTIGAKLFDRIGRRNVLTNIGKLLYENALKHMALKEETIQALEGHQGVRKGEVTIGGSTIPGECILPGLIGQFHVNNPRILIRLKIQDTAEIAAGVSQGDLAFGLVGAMIEQEELEYTPIWDDELVVITSAKHPWAGRKQVNLQELAAEPFILREAGSGTRQLLEKNISLALGGRRVDLNVVAELGSSAAIKTGVMSGLGVSVISNRAIGSEVDAKKLSVLAINGFNQRRYFYAVKDRRRTLSPLATAFFNYLKKSSDISKKAT